MFKITDIKNYFDAFPANTEMRLYLKEKSEIFIFISIGVTLNPHPIEVDITEIGESAIDFLYDSQYESIINWLQNSVRFMEKLKEDPKSLDNWKPFYYLSRKLHHPFFFYLKSCIVNAYHSGVMDSNNTPLPDDYFKQIGESYQRLRANIQEMAKKFFDITAQNSSVIQEHYKLAFTNKYIRYSDVFGELILPSSIYQEPIPVGTYVEHVAPQYVIGEVLHPKTPEDIGHFLFVSYSLRNIQYKRCSNCQRYFNATGKSNVKYCDRRLNDEDKTCRQTAPKTQFLEKAKDNPAEKLFNKVYKTMYSRVSSGAMNKQLFKEWSKEARRLRDDCTAGKITVEDFAAWLGEALGRNPLHYK